MNTVDTPWFVWVLVIVIQFGFMYALTKHHERELDEQIKRERKERKL